MLMTKHCDEPGMDPGIVKGAQTLFKDYRGQ